MPGFGFSGPTRAKGWNVNRVARAWAELMRRLDYERYAAQGGDMGALITPELGRVAPGSVIGIHVTAATVGFQPLGPVPDDVQAQLTDQERQRLGAIGMFAAEGSGYQAIQSTRPQTLAYGLTDSAVGLLAWIIEKFKEWSNPSAELPEDAVDRDTLLTNVMLYWLTATAGSAARMYYEGRKHAGAGWFPPHAFRGAYRGGELRRAHGDPALGGGTNTAVRWTEFDRGGHFAAVEAPERLTKTSGSSSAHWLSSPEEHSSGAIGARLLPREHDRADHWAMAAGNHHYPQKPTKAGAAPTGDTSASDE